MDRILIFSRMPSPAMNEALTRHCSDASTCIPVTPLLLAISGSAPCFRRCCTHNRVSENASPTTGFQKMLHPQSSRFHGPTNTPCFRRCCAQGERGASAPSRLRLPQTLGCIGACDQVGGWIGSPCFRGPSSASLGLTKSIMSFYSTQLAKSNLFQRICQLLANRCDLGSSF